MRAYFNGVEINQIPELKEVCAMDDWLSGFLRWVRKKHPDIKIFDAIMAMESPSVEDANVLEIWVGGAPPMRAMEIGGTLRKFVSD